MTTEHPELQPWQVFKIAIKRKNLGPGVVASCFGNKNAKNSRSGYDWAQDPTYTQKRCRNPLEMMHDFFSRLDSIGHDFVARAAINYLETAIEPDTEAQAVKDVLPTLEQEMLADYPTVTAFHEAIHEGADIDTIELLERAAKEEISRTTIKYRQELGA